MTENTSIEWTDHTFNPWIGCTRISPACDHCYAADIAKRFGHAKWGAGEERKVTSESNWKKPFTWQRKAKAFYAEQGRRQRVFCASMADVFDNEAPMETRERLFKLIEETPDLDWLLLTKRIGNVSRMLEMMGRAELPRNVWLGITICNQDEANRDIVKLMKIPATVRFLSIEPMLGRVDLRRLAPDGITFTIDALTGKGEHLLGYTGIIGKIHWVIAGGESGAKARTTHPSWIIGLRDQCEAAGTPFLFKQWGEFRPVDADSVLHTGIEYKRMGKSKAGRRLHGRTHDEFPA